MDRPVRYATALRRRWWVIALAVLVAVATAWFTTTIDHDAPATSATAPYQATTVLWDPETPVQGIPSVDSGSITGMDALAQVVTLPDVVALASARLDGSVEPATLREQVVAAADPTSGFLDITGYGADPGGAERVSTAFSQALRDYLEQIKARRLEQQQAQLEAQLEALKAEGAGPAELGPLREGLSQLALDRTAPISLTIIQRAQAEPATGQAFRPPESRTGRALLAAIIGLLAGIALALVLERFDTRIRTREDAEAGFALPVLVEIPDIAHRWRRQVVTATHPMSRVADAFRLLSLAVARTAPLEVGASNGNGHREGRRRADEPPPKVILVTSPEARDGKTTVAANLAAAYAEVGRRVLVLSCDLRRPDIDRLFGVPDRPGVAEALAAIGREDPPPERFDLLPYIGLPTIGMVAVMPGGASAERSVELLGSDQMALLLGRAREIADVVILDGAPLLVASDVVPLLTHADAVVVIARANKTRSEVAARSTELLTRLGGKVVGVVLNDADDATNPLGRHRYYHYYRQKKDAKDTVRVPDSPKARAERDEALEMWAGR